MAVGAAGVRDDEKPGRGRVQYLPDATLVVAHFHVVKLANDVLAEVRRRVTTTTRGRRGREQRPRMEDPQSAAPQPGGPHPRALAKLWNTLVDLGEPGLIILASWIAKDELRALLALAGTRPDRTVIAHRLTRFYNWCVDAGVLELERLATTVSIW